MSEIDLLTVGRVNLDLYAQQVGVAFEDVVGWDAMVGGSPVNVAIAAARLGLNASVFTAVGDDLVGDWVLRALGRERVGTDFVQRKTGSHTSLALRAQLAPDHPLVFYRHDPADIHLTLAEAEQLPLEHVRVVLVSADALARGSTREAAVAILARAQALGTTLFLDLDFREVNWPDLETYAASVSVAVESADIVLGTEAEFAALLSVEPGDGEAAVAEALRARVALDSGRIALLKRGEHGATLFEGACSIPVPAFSIAEASTVGAGDSFAAGLIFGRLRGMEWHEATRFASACAAITASRFGCSRGFPQIHEVVPLLESGLMVPC